MGIFSSNTSTTPYSFGGQTYNLAPDWYNLVKKDWGHKEGDTYWGQWIKDVASGALAGQPHYEYGKYAELKSGEDALKKQQMAEQAKIQGTYGDVQGQLQEQFAQRGLGRSGLFNESLGRAQGMEQEQLDALRNRIEQDRQNMTQGLQNQWWQERMANRDRRDSKRSRKYGVASSILGTAGNAATFGLLK